MWVRLTIVKLQPGKSDEARKIYYEELVPVVKELKGHIDMFVLEPVDEKDEFIKKTREKLWYTNLYIVLGLINLVVTGCIILMIT